MIKSLIKKAVRILSPFIALIFEVIMVRFLLNAVFVGALAFALPTGLNVIEGNITPSSPDPLTIQIHQGTDKAIIEWHSFNIGGQEKVNFVQPSSNAIVMNRINSAQGMSHIYGQLTANGRIILINQAGIYFGPGSYVNVASIIVSTSNLSNANFLAGQYIFDEISPFAGAVINAGTIIARDNGLVALLGAGVTNSGMIQARLGKVILASGNKFTIDFYGDQVISFTINEGTTKAGIDENDQVLKSGVTNTGVILANGGLILVTAKAANAVLDNTINMKGIVIAQSVSSKNGEIIFSAGEQGTVRVSGKVNVSSVDNKGGKIKILGKNIQIESSAELNASGQTGGGEILVGGNAHGAGPEMNALTTTVASGALFEANALMQGDGGKIIIWSDEATRFYGSISAQGGEAGGNGGFVETSGAYLDVTGIHINLSAAHGTSGTWLIDPENLIIQTAGTTTATASGSPTSTYTSNVDTSILTIADLQNALASSSVLVETGIGGLEEGDITLLNNLTWGNANTLILSAFRNININATITNTLGGSLSLQSDNTGTGIGTVIFAGATPQINMSGGGAVNLYYNPVSYPTPTNYTSNVNVSGGTTFTPYMLVNNLINLQNMNNNLSGNYALPKNIDASATSGWNAGAGFVPIGSIASNFTGQFDGQNHTIDGLTIFLPLASNVGLFGYVNTLGAIQNVGLTNMVITGLNNVGGLVGFDAAGTINNTYSTGSVTSDANSSNVGGLVGFSGGNVNNSYSTATVLAGATSNYIGGLVGQAGASISASYHATGSVTAGATSHYVGGLVGYNLGSVSHAYNTGPVEIGATGSTNLGGLIGYSAGNVYYSYNTGAVTVGAAVTNVGGLIGYGFGTVSHSYSTGSIVTGATGSTNIGGLVGYAGNDISNSYSNSGILGGAANNNVGGLVGQNNAIISNSYSTGSVAAGAGSTFLGGLVGLNNTMVNNSFWDIQTSAQLASAGGDGKTTAEMMQQTTFCPSGNCGGDLTHFDFVSNWGIVNGVSYPYILPATLTYNANISSMTYGDTPSLTGTVTGFVGSETQASATMGILAFTSLATSTSNVGNYAITGSGLTANYGNYVFAQAAANATAFTITQAPLTLTANNQSKTYGDTLALGTSAFTPTGLQNSETVGSVTLTSSGAVNTANVAGSPYAIVPSAAIGGSFNPANYSITYANGALTINPASLTVTANNASKSYGQTTGFTGTEFSSSGLQNSETIGSVTLMSSGAVNTANVAGSPYAIVPSAATGGSFNPANYSMTYSNGALTINPATLTYIANTATRFVEQENPAFSGTITGFVMGQTQASATTGTMEFTSLAALQSDAGQYLISGSGLTANAGNYIFTQALGNVTALTINPAVINPAIINTTGTTVDISLVASVVTPFDGVANAATISGVTDLSITNNVSGQQSGINNLAFGPQTGLATSTVSTQGVGNSVVITGSIVQEGTVPAAGLINTTTNYFINELETSDNDLSWSAIIYLILVIINIGLLGLVVMLLLNYFLIRRQTAKINEVADQLTRASINNLLENVKWVNHAVSVIRSTDVENLLPNKLPSIYHIVAVPVPKGVAVVCLLTGPSHTKAFFTAIGVLPHDGRLRSNAEASQFTHDL